MINVESVTIFLFQKLQCHKRETSYPVSCSCENLSSYTVYTSIKQYLRFLWCFMPTNIVRANVHNIYIGTDVELSG